MTNYLPVINFFIHMHLYLILTLFTQHRRKKSIFQSWYQHKIVIPDIIFTIFNISNRHLSLTYDIIIWSTQENIEKEGRCMTSLKLCVIIIELLYIVYLLLQCFVFLPVEFCIYWEEWMGFFSSMFVDPPIQHECSALNSFIFCSIKSCSVGELSTAGCHPSSVSNH